MAELNTVLADGFDREAFERAYKRSPALNELAQRLGSLLPPAEPLVGDLFYSLFKLNAVVHPEEAVAPSILINRALVSAVKQSTSPGSVLAGRTGRGERFAQTASGRPSR